MILPDSNCLHCRDRRIRKLIFFEQEVLHPKMSYQEVTFEWLFFFISLCVFCRGYQLHNAFHTIWSSNVGSNAAVSFHDHFDCSVKAVSHWNFFLKPPWGNNPTLWLNEAMPLQNINRQPARSAGKLKLILSSWEYRVRFFAPFHQVKFACHSGFMAVLLVGCYYEYTIVINFCLAY